MKIYSFITTDRTANRQGAHRFQRLDIRVGSAADSVQIADIEITATENATKTATLYSVKVDGVQIASGESVKGERTNVRRIAEVRP